MNLKLILLTSLIGLISGCNGGNSESNASENINLVEPKSVRIEASQTKSKALVGEDSSIEVSAVNDASVAMEIVPIKTHHKGCVPNNCIAVGIELNL